MSRQFRSSILLLWFQFRTGRMRRFGPIWSDRLRVWTDGCGRWKRYLSCRGSCRGQRRDAWMLDYAVLEGLFQKRICGTIGLWYAVGQNMSEW